MPPPKKAAAKHANRPDPLKEERRAYEHLGRVEALRAHLDKGAVKEISSLVDLAQKELEAGHPKDAADLLRAAEHLSFGALSAPKAGTEAHPKLRDELSKEFKHKLEKAEEHWDDEDEHDSALHNAYQSARERADKFFDEGKYRQALELARGAEALAHVKLHSSNDEEIDQEA